MRTTYKEYETEEAARQAALRLCYDYGLRARAEGCRVTVDGTEQKIYPSGATVTSLTIERAREDGV